MKSPVRWFALLLSLALVVSSFIFVPDLLAAQQDGSATEPTAEQKAESEPTEKEGKEAEEEKKPGLDEKIDKAFKPIADAWGGIVFYPVTLGPNEKFEQGDTNEDGKFDATEYLAFLKGTTPFAELDANEDGFLTPVEAKLETEELEKGDTNDDGKFDITEYEKFSKSREPFAKLDANNDGFLTAKEADLKPEKFESGDTNKDGKFDANEYDSFLFAQLDGNDDGFLTPTEAKLRTQVPIIIFVLVGGAVFFTLVFGFINLRLIPFAIRVVSGKYDHIEKSDLPKSKPSETAAVNQVDGDLVDTIRDEGREKSPTSKHWRPPFQVPSD